MHATFGKHRRGRTWTLAFNRWTLVVSRAAVEKDRNARIAERRGMAKHLAGSQAAAKPEKVDRIKKVVKPEKAEENLLATEKVEREVVTVASRTRTAANRVENPDKEKAPDATCAEKMDIELANAQTVGKDPRPCKWAEPAMAKDIGASHSSNSSNSSRGLRLQVRLVMVLPLRLPSLRHIEIGLRHLRVLLSSSSSNHSSNSSRRGLQGKHNMDIRKVDVEYWQVF